LENGSLKIKGEILVPAKSPRNWTKRAIAFVIGGLISGIILVPQIFTKLTTVLEVSMIWFLALLVGFYLDHIRQKKIQSR